jgi:hypothetical protein
MDKLLTVLQNIRPCADVATEQSRKSRGRSKHRSRSRSRSRTNNRSTDAGKCRNKDQAESWNMGYHKSDRKGEIVIGVAPAHNQRAEFEEEFQKQQEEKYEQKQQQKQRKMKQQKLNEGLKLSERSQSEQERVGRRKPRSAVVAMSALSTVGGLSSPTEGTSVGGFTESHSTTFSTGCTRFLYPCIPTVLCL